LIHGREDAMPLKILPHGRLQEWVAEEQGYFSAEGLEYTFLPEGDYGVPAGQVSTVTRPVLMIKKRRVVLVPFP